MPGQLKVDITDVKDLRDAQVNDIVMLHVECKVASKQGNILTLESQQETVMPSEDEMEMAEGEEGEEVVQQIEEGKRPLQDKQPPEHAGPTIVIVRPMDLRGKSAEEMEKILPKKKDEYA